MDKRRFAISLCFIISIFIVSCNSNTQNHHSKKKNRAVVEKKHKAQKVRKEKVDVSKPVAVFKQNTDDLVTDNDFIVKVYPTLEADQFKLDIQYGGNTASDKVEMLPKEYYKKIELRKGDVNGTCVLGFIDNKGKFNKMSLITASGTSIHIKKLKAYYLSSQ